jgi:two-component system response regulator NreC
MQCFSRNAAEHIQAPIRVILIEDHDLIRHTLKLYLESSGKYQVVGEAREVGAGLALTKQLNPELALVDIGLPDSSGLEYVSLAKQASLQVKVICLSMYEDTETIKRALEVGATGYIHKSCAPEVFLEQIKKILEGEVIQPSITRSRHLEMVRPAEQSSDPLKKLSRREREIFMLLAEGQPNRAIAKLLLISPRTVETHRARVIKKLGFSSTSDLVRFAIRNQLLTA